MRNITLSLSVLMAVAVGAAQDRGTGYYNLLPGAYGEIEEIRLTFPGADSVETGDPLRLDNPFGISQYYYAESTVNPETPDTGIIRFYSLDEEGEKVYTSLTETGSYTVMAEVSGYDYSNVAFFKVTYGDETVAWKPATVNQWVPPMLTYYVYDWVKPESDPADGSQVEALDEIVFYASGSTVKGYGKAKVYAVTEWGVDAGTVVAEMAVTDEDPDNTAVSLGENTLPDGIYAVCTDNIFQVNYKQVAYVYTFTVGLNTGVEVNAAETDGDVMLYTVSGAPAGRLSALDALAPGLYIGGGRKFIKR